MRSEQVKCDHCEKAIRGNWIFLEEFSAVKKAIMGGDSFLEVARDLDFCCLDCLLGYMNELIGEKT